MTLYTINHETIVILGEMGKQVKAAIEKIEMPILEQLYNINEPESLADYSFKNIQNNKVSGTWDTFTSQEILEQIQRCFEQAYGHGSMEVRQLEQNLKIIQYGKDVLTTQNILTDQITLFCDTMNRGLDVSNRCIMPGLYELCFHKKLNRKSHPAQSSRKHYEPSDIRSVQREKKFRDPFNQKRNSRL